MFTANQQVREQELVALRKALEIITGKAVQEKYSGNVVQSQIPSCRSNLLDTSVSLLSSSNVVWLCLRRRCHR